MLTSGGILEGPSGRDGFGVLQQELVHKNRRKAYEAVRAHVEERSAEELSAEAGGLTEFLDEDAAVLSLYEGAERIVGTVTSRAQTVKIELDTSPKEIRQLMDELRKKMVDENIGESEVERVSERLYRLVLAPVEGALARYSLIGFQGFGALRYLPVAALYDGNAFAVEKKAFFYVSNYGIARRSGESARREGPLHLLAMGDPDGTLPAARQEIVDIGGLFREPQEYVGEMARKEVFKKYGQRSDVIHLATHGVLNDVDPSLSYLQFAGPTLDAQQLRPKDIGQLDLGGTQLVVLSACESAAGVVEDGTGSERRGLDGIAIEFERAGARAIVASLWRVDDQATASLLGEFYRHFLEGAGTARALQEAQKKLLATEVYRHPRYWAGFVLVGDPR